MELLERISRDEAATFPSFQSHEEARAFFIEKYGDAFQLTDSEDGIFFYHLILDATTYWNAISQLNKLGFIQGSFLTSYQDIQIFKDGHVHIVF